jgi:electron transfer flavoprotein beta subunit
MKFSVCIKQVPDVSAPIQVRGGELVLDPNRLVLNAYDASAVEAALVLAERYGGEVEVVLVGPDRAQETLRKALAMGAERGILLRCDGRDLDSRDYAELLAGYFREASVEVVLCGKQAQDTDAGLTGAMLAALLDLPYATNAVGLDLEDAAGRVVVTRQGDTGQEVLELPVPCLVTCSNDMNDPRIPNLKGIMAAKRKVIDVKDVAPFVVSDRPGTRTLGYQPMPERAPGRLLEGEPEEAARLLRTLLQNEAKVL